MKRILVISDLHCGSLVGLTPPSDQSSKDTKWGKTQRTCWDFYKKQVNLFKPYDVVIVNGDAVHGDAKKDGGTMLITTDRVEQAEMAAKCIIEPDCNVVRLTYGTPFHTGNQEDFEGIIAMSLRATGMDAKICSHGFYSIGGKNFNVKHKVASSGVSYGRLTPVAKEINWNRAWAARGEEAKADVLIRSHVHYFGEVKLDGCVGITTPSLQGLGDKYGSRQCSGTVDFGIVVIDILDDGIVIVRERLMGGTCQAHTSELL